MKVDFLIVGQGLAGSLLAWELIRRDCKVLVLDNGAENASLCAAGLMNPITGMRFVKSPQVDVLLPVAKNYYQNLSAFFKKNFYVEKNILRILNSEKELHYAEKKLQDAAYQDYLGNLTRDLSGFKNLTGLNAPFGILEQTQTAYLLTQPLLSALKQFLLAKQSYQICNFAYADVSLMPNLSWRGIDFKKIIFCEGYQMLENPWFSALPLQPAKGEILTLESFKPLPDKILNYGQWMIPLEAGIFRTGATFDPVNLNTLCTETAKNHLLNALLRVFPAAATAKLLNQQAHIRPCTLDKQPFIGSHPHYPDLTIFNGFGAKGSLQIPYYAQQFADYLLENKPLAAAVNSQRYLLKA